MASIAEKEANRYGSSGRASSSKSQWVLVTPLERKLPRVKIQTRQLSFLLNKRILVSGGREKDLEFMYVSLGIHYSSPFTFPSPLAAICLFFLLLFVQVSIDSWPRNSQYPLGHYKKCIGSVGDREAENEALLLEHNVDDQPFASGVLACVPPLPWNVVESDLKNREDLRGWTICSVDPPGCKDIDDALSIREDPTDPNLLEVR